MHWKTFPAMLAAFAITTSWVILIVDVHQAEAGQYRVSRGDDLFYNYYVGPAQVAGGVPAGLSPSPLPTPPLVGHTYITYQPLMPHETLYRHHRHYYRHHPAQGWVRTKVRWR